jgi:hypothetical protein
MAAPGTGAPVARPALNDKIPQDFCFATGISAVGSDFSEKTTSPLATCLLSVYNTIFNEMNQCYHSTAGYSGRSKNCGHEREKVQTFEARGAGRKA